MALWAELPAGFRDIVERVCTSAEVRVLITMYENQAGLKKTASILGLKRSTVRTLHRRADRKIRQEVAAMRGVA